ncbi:TLC domain-containing protein At5g14285-like [Andrographis paniculata]|uniref:TLC domain-containing protein At5g14285-like n=1 Tax=Andrographis paniculata TaxID=175694 RepID=UPI0021E6E4CF|nr:TLC domain-containing protein At5g14285-like [Andrographis paniculata]
MEITKLFSFFFFHFHGSEALLLPCLFSLWFLSTYILGYSILFRNWGKISRPLASSSLMSLAHGTPALLLALLALSPSCNPQFEFEFESESEFPLFFQFHLLNSPNTGFQDVVLEYSTAYFLMDLLHYIVFVPSEVLFIAHHLATLYVLITCRYVFGHGAVAILGILVIAEMTTICQNTWSLARYRKAHSHKAAAIFHILSPIFYTYYTAVRGILAPAFVYKLVMIPVPIPIPRWGWMSWLVVTIVGIGVSWLWILNLWIDLLLLLYRRRRHESIDLAATATLKKLT